MYLEHYQLRRMPFEIDPDPKFLWLGSKHEEALSVLRYGIMESKGFVVITGEPGTGKSTLLNATVASFGSDCRFARIGDPALNEMDFFHFAANALDMAREFQTKGDFLIELGKFTRQAGAKKVILIIDEAQRLTPKMLEQVRVFSSMEHEGAKCVSSIFAGQPEFLDLLKQNRALSQRVFFSHTIHPLTASETAEYIAHRLKVAGREKPIFTPPAVHEIFRLSEGVPRLINLLCDHALVSGYGSNLTQIGPELILDATESTLIPLLNNTVMAKPEKKTPSADFQVPSQETGPQPRRSRKAIYLPAIAAAVILGLGLFLYRGGGSQGDTLSPVASMQPVAAATEGNIGGQGLQELAELRSQRDAAELRIKELLGRSEQLEGELKALQTVRERAAGFEKALAAKEAAVAELRQKLEISDTNQSNVAVLKSELESIRKDNSRLQAELAETAGRKSAAEARLVQEQKLNAELSAAVRDLKAARDRVAQLEASLAERDRKLTQLALTAVELEKTLDREKETKAQMAAELSSRQAAVADLQKKAEAAKSHQQKLEIDNARLQSQLRDLTPKSAVVSAPAPPAQAPTSSPPPATPARPGAAPDPSGAIDFVINRRSQ